MAKKLRKTEIFYSLPLISGGNIKEITFSITQFNILKLVSKDAKIKPMARALHCDPPNIRYHLKKLELLNLVYKTAEMGVWQLTKEGKQVISGGGKKKVVVKKKLVKKACINKKRQPTNRKLTKMQSLVYSLIVEEGKTQESVSIKLKTSQQNISQHYNKALKKLHLIGGNKKELVLGMSQQPISPQTTQRFRAHNYRWIIEILEKKEGFKIGSDKIGNCKISIWKNKIQIVSQDDFFADTIEKSFYKGLDYFYSIFNELEKLYHVKINKKGILNKNLYQCDIANINNEMANILIEEGNKFYVRDENGKAWAVFDNSFKLFEFETILASSVVPDHENVQRHLNDWRKNPKCTKLSDIDKNQKEILLYIDGFKEILEIKQNQDNENTLRITGIIKILENFKERLKNLENK